MSEVPAYDALPKRGGVGCAWNVWGTHDVFGCLNLLTPDRIAAASGQVERGAIFPLDWDMKLPDPPLFGRAATNHEVRRLSDFIQDDVIHDWNTQASTQWDGFRHVCFVGEGWFGGVENEDHGVHHWAQRGVAGRGVLVDMGRWREAVGRPLNYDSSDTIDHNDIRACLSDQGTSVEPGDILLLRTGWLEWYRSLDAEQRATLAETDDTELRIPGLEASEDTARMLWDMHVSAVAADNPALERCPIPNHSDPSRQYEVQLHLRILSMLGIPIGELFDFDPLAADCAADGRYTCFFTSAVLNLEHGVASPPNALAFK